MSCQKTISYAKAKLNQIQDYNIKLKLIFTWVKQDVISSNTFAVLIDEIKKA